MIITDSLTPLGTKTSVAVGYFDGMHRGHLAVLREALSQAREYALEPVLLTFDMSRSRAGGKGKKDLLPEEFKRRKAEELGFRYYIRLDFPSISGLSEKEFIDRILSHGCLNAAVVVCGDDFRYGKDRSGDVRSLTRLCGPYGIRVVPVRSLIYNDESISTSRIKKCLESGDIPMANKLLGFPYFLEGTVTEGNGLAHTLGFPTANLLFPAGLTVPKKGVYLSRTTVGGAVYPSITNIGTRPTVTEDVLPISETHLVDFSGDLYGKQLHVELFKFLRPEKQFSSVEELQQTVLQNVEYARTVVLGDIRY